MLHRRSSIHAHRADCVHASSKDEMASATDVAGAILIQHLLAWRRDLQTTFPPPELEIRKKERQTMDSTLDPIAVYGPGKACPEDVRAYLASAGISPQSHGITTHEQLEKVAASAEARLERSAIHESKRDGAVLSYLPSGPPSTCEEGKTVFGTYETFSITLLRQDSSWLLTELRRREVYPNAPSRDEIALPQEALLDLMKNALDRYAPLPTDSDHYLGINLGSFFCALANAKLLKTGPHSSAHDKLNAVQIVERIIAANTPGSKP